MTCRKVEGPPFQSVISPPLPDIRVTEYQPFWVTGVDYAGPLYIRNNTKVTKVYMTALYLCSNTSDTSLDSRRSNCKFVFTVLQAIHKQERNSRIHHLGQCKDIQAGSQELTTLKSQILNTAEPQRFLAHHRIKWQFITERAPWRGGFYERLIGLVKKD